jgi:hypothetical protein
MLHGISVRAPIMVMAKLCSRASRWVDLKPMILACGSLLTLLAQFGVPVLANTSCGLIISHDHVLIGLADGDGLERHLLAEANCAIGTSDAPDEQASALQGGKGQILSVIYFDGNTTSQFTSLNLVIADLPTLVTVDHFRTLYFLLESIYLFGQSVSIPLPTPPPKAL